MDRLRESFARHGAVAFAVLILLLAVLACGGSNELPTLMPTAAAVEVPAATEELPVEPALNDTMQPSDTPATSAHTDTAEPPETPRSSYMPQPTPDLLAANDIIRSTSLSSSNSAYIDDLMDATGSLLSAVNNFANLFDNETFKEVDESELPEIFSATDSVKESYDVLAAVNVPDDMSEFHKLYIFAANDCQEPIEGLSNSLREATSNTTLSLKLNCDGLETMLDAIEIYLDREANAVQTASPSP